jgi:hypothetical protein
VSAGSPHNVAGSTYRSWFGSSIPHTLRKVEEDDVGEIIIEDFLAEAREDRIGSMLLKLSCVLKKSGN